MGQTLFEAPGNTAMGSKGKQANAPALTELMFPSRASQQRLLVTRFQAGFFLALLRTSSSGG